MSLTFPIKLFQDVIETTAVPIIASHSSVRAIASHARNLTDEMIRMVADQEELSISITTTPSG